MSCYREVTSAFAITKPAQATGALTVETYRDPERAVLVLSGEIDLATVAQLESELVNAATAHRPRIVIDLADVQFIDCTGLRALIRAQRRADADSHSLILRNVPAQAELLFRLAQAADQFVTQHT